LSRRYLLQRSLGLAGFGWASGCGLFPRGQDSPNVARIGYLDFGSPGAATSLERPIVQGLRDLGWVEGENLVIEYRFAEGSYERQRALAAELVELKVDVLYSQTATGALAAKQVTGTIPIVFGGIGDPVGSGVVESFARPGGNATGTSSLVEGLAPKLLELLKEMVPTISRVAVLWHSVAAAHWAAIEAAAPRLGVVPRSLEVRDSGELDGAFSTLKEHPADGLVVLSGAALFAERNRIVGLAAQYRLPAAYPFVEYAEAGGLLAYAANLPELYRRAAVYVDKILKGAKPADLPVEQPTKFDLVLNLRTAQALGLTVPQSVLLQTTKVIQ
jgi:putative ABC transport system substrate-binding protein